MGPTTRVLSGDQCPFFGLIAPMGVSKFRGPIERTSAKKGLLSYGQPEKGPPIHVLWAELAKGRGQRSMGMSLFALTCRRARSWAFRTWESLAGALAMQLHAFAYVYLYVGRCTCKFSCIYMYVYMYMCMYMYVHMHVYV